MRILVTGVAGFVGSHLVERYLADGHQVVGVDNYLTGSPANLKKAFEQRAFTFVEADVAAGWTRVRDTLFRSNILPELILHLASPASPIDYAKLPLETMAANSRGTQNCCEEALRCGARFLYASTSEAYGDPLEHPQRESYWGNVNPLGPRSCYDESKRFGEALVMSFVRVKNLDARIIRIFNTYGPRMRRDDGRVVPNFIHQALLNQPLTIYGDGSQTRSFCYVDDLIEGIVRCACSDLTRGLATNIGNPEEQTIKEFAQMVCRVVGVKPRLRHMPLPADDPGRRQPDITRARDLLQWRPVVSLEDGLRRTIDFFRPMVTH